MPQAPKFDADDEWLLYVERLQQFFKAYKVEADRQAALLLTAVSNDVYKTISNACFPNNPSAKTFDELCAIFKTQFSPLFSVHAERFKFNEAKQETGESITDWFTRVKFLASNCEYGDHLDHSLKDKFICGLTKGPILDKMFEMKIADSLQQCYDAALLRELTVNNKQTISMQEINALRRDSKSKKNHFEFYKKSAVSPKSQKEQNKCFACGKEDHNFATCNYKSHSCSNCNRVGHTPRVCPYNQQIKKSYQNNYIGNESTNKEQSESDASDTESNDEYFLYSLNDAKRNPFVLQLTVNGIRVEFEVDTGASLSVCSRAFYEKTFAALPLKKSKIILHSYNKSIIEPIGAVEMAIEYNGKEIRSNILVIESGGRPLIGRDVLRKMNINKVCELILFDKLRFSDSKMPSNLSNSNEATGKKKRVNVGDRVRVRNYQSKAMKWTAATITKTVGNSIFLCETSDGIWKRHIDQIRPLVNSHSHITNKRSSFDRKSNEIYVDCKIKEKLTPAKATEARNSPLHGTKTTEVSSPSSAAKATEAYNSPLHESKATEASRSPLRNVKATEASEPAEENVTPEKAAKPNSYRRESTKHHISQIVDHNNEFNNSMSTVT